MKLIYCSHPLEFQVFSPTALKVVFSPTALKVQAVVGGRYPFLDLS